MRPVSQERKSPKTRGQSGRTPSRGITRGAAQQPFGRRAKLRNDPFSRFFRFLRGLLDARRPVLWMTVVLVVLTGLAILFASGIIGRTIHRTNAAAEALVAEAGFGIAQVHLSGNVRTSPVTIMAALGLKHGQPIFDVDLQAARARLRQLPWVADAEVRRRYPDDISVRIIERVPFARWHSRKGLFVVERSGRPITGEGVDTFLGLPLLVGEGAPGAAGPLIEAVRRHRIVAAHVTAYQYQSERRWNLLLGDDLVIKLPETGWEKQLSDLDRLISVKRVMDTDIREIDMRSPTHYFVVRRNAAPGQEKTAVTGSSI